MAGIVRRLAPVLALLVACGAAGGCAGKNLRVDLSYAPSLELPKASGKVFLVVPKGEAPKEGGEWVLGEVKNREGKQIARVFASGPPAEGVVEAFAEELRRAGYAVERVPEMPPQAEKGVSFREVRVTVDAVIHRVTAEVNGEAAIATEVVRKGTPVVRLSHAARTARTAGRGVGNPGETVYRETVADLLRQAMPPIVAELEKKE